MLGMEMMLAKMIGLTPDEMQAQIADVKNNLGKFVTAMETINAKCDRILETMERIENAGNGNRDKPTSRKRLPVSGDTGSGGTASS